jgi:DNA-binding response OmpR family regulator
MSKLNLLKNLTILVADDDLESLDTFKIILSTYFKNVITCCDGLEAYTKFQENGIDMILIDYIMPHINGYELSYKLRKINKKIPITIMSSYSDKDKLLNIIPLKITNYLLKPITLSRLHETLNMMINELEETGSLCKKKEFSNFSYDFTTRQLIDLKYKKEIIITKSEIAFMELLIKNENKIVSYNMINDSFKEIKSEQAIKNLIYRLRLKLGEDLIENSHGMGYILKTNNFS